MMWSFVICTPHQILFGWSDQDGACGTYGSNKGAYRVWWGDLRERDHLQVLGTE